jgi:hypothetical protein
LALPALHFRYVRDQPGGEIDPAFRRLLAQHDKRLGS